MEPKHILINFVKYIRTDLFQEDKNKNMHNKNNKKNMIDVVHPVKQGVGVENLWNFILTDWGLVKLFHIMEKKVEQKFY